MSAALYENRYKSALYNAMRKYGRYKFHISLIQKYEAPDKKELLSVLNKEEQFYIIKYHSLVSENGYNFEKGGNNKIVPGRKVCKYDKDLNLLNTYISLQEAGRENNIDSSTIWAVCRHDYFTAAGFVWAYEGEIPIKPHYKTPDEYNRKPIEKKPYISKALPADIKKSNKFQRCGWRDEEIYQYNTFGDIINIYNDIEDARKKLNKSTTEINRNLTGKNLCFNKTILRYASDPFDKFKRSNLILPVTLYDLQGNFIKNFESHKDAEEFLNVPRGEIAKVLKRGGSCRNYLVSEYDKPLKRKLYKRTRTICMCDSNWNVLKVFNGNPEISNYFNIKDCHHQISKAIDNKTLYRNYYWKYKEEFALTA